MKKLSNGELNILADEIREFLIENVSKTGGHLASNLGAVELTLAIHRVFDTKTDRLVFDVGHQCYVHKIITGRRDDFSTLRQYGGISGFPKPSESGDDAFIAGHASNSIAVAAGMAKARTLSGEDYNVVALIGDGAMTGGLAYEGLSFAGQSKEPMIVILNDNGMSISRNVGGMSRYLSSHRVRPGYYKFKQAYRRIFNSNPLGRVLYKFNHKVKKVVKYALLPTTLFEEMGFTYLGPIDGHDIDSITYFLQYAKKIEGPVLIHVNTVKGKGYEKAETTPDIYHGVSPFEPQYGVIPTKKKDFSAVFGECVLKCADEDKRVCAISAAMTESIGFGEFFRRYPKRGFDVGIAEQNAVAMAGGLAKQGMIPVAAIYSTFLQRAYDMIIHDVALDGLHVVFGVDRAGITGPDGETHQGVFDVAFLTSVPGLRVFCPASYAELSAITRHAVLEMTGPVAVRYPRGCEGGYTQDNSSVPSKLIRSGDDITIITYGILVNNALSAAALLEEDGISVGVLKLTEISEPDREEILAAAKRTGKILVVEDCVEHGSVGERIGAMLEDAELGNIVFDRVNVGQDFVPHGKTEELWAMYGIDALGITHRAAKLCGNAKELRI